MTRINAQQAIELARQRHAARKLDEAESLYRQVLQQLPQRHDLMQNLAQLLFEKGQPSEALQWMRRATNLAPQTPDYHGNLGMLLSMLGIFDEAIPEFRQAISLRPDVPEIYNNLGNCLRETGQFEKAIAIFGQALKLRPNYPEAKWNLSFVLLTQGNFQQGLELYESRLQMASFPNCQFPQQMWDGSNLNGRRILLYAEQGMGDTFNFIRYAPMVADRGGRVMALCQPPTKRLLAIQQLKVEQWIAEGESIPDFEVRCPLLSLPRLFGTTPESIPSNVPYLRADRELVSQWRGRLKQTPARLRVGLVWAGNPYPIHNRKRSTTLAELAPLARSPDTIFYSLQKGEGSDQAKNPPAGMKLIDRSDELHDFADTAALIEALDLIITIDTGTAHLSGALGKPTWVLLPYVPDWRWLMDRTDSPWYPTMKLFRQPRLGDWATPIARLAEELRRLRWDSYDGRGPDLSS